MQVTLAYKMSLHRQPEAVILSFDEEEPFNFVFGTSKIPPGFETGLKGLVAGDEAEIYVPSKEAYDHISWRCKFTKKNLLFRVQILDVAEHEK